MPKAYLIDGNSLAYRDFYALPDTMKTSTGITTNAIYGFTMMILKVLEDKPDFVARNSDFLKFAKDVAMQIAAQNPQYIYVDDVPQGVVDNEKDIIATQAETEGKPAKATEKIVEGRIQKFYEEVCLLEQAYIRDPKIKIKDLLGELAAKIGENIVIRRFTRYQLGEKS